MPIKVPDPPRTVIFYTAHSYCPSCHYHTACAVASGEVTRTHLNLNPSTVTSSEGDYFSQPLSALEMSRRNHNDYDGFDVEYEARRMIKEAPPPRFSDSEPPYSDSRKKPVPPSSNPPRLIRDDVEYAPPSSRDTRERRPPANRSRDRSMESDRDRDDVERVPPSSRDTRERRPPANRSRDRSMENDNDRDDIERDRDTRERRPPANRSRDRSMENDRDRDRDHSNRDTRERRPPANRSRDRSLDQDDLERAPSYNRDTRERRPPSSRSRDRSLDHHYDETDQVFDRHRSPPVRKNLDDEGNGWRESLLDSGDRDYDERDDDDNYDVRESRERSVRSSRESHIRRSREPPKGFVPRSYARPEGKPLADAWNDKSDMRHHEKENARPRAEDSWAGTIKHRAPPPSRGSYRRDDGSDDDYEDSYRRRNDSDRNSREGIRRRDQDQHYERDSEEEYYRKQRARDQQDKGRGKERGYNNSGYREASLERMEEFDLDDGEENEIRAFNEVKPRGSEKRQQNTGRYARYDEPRKLDSPNDKFTEEDDYRDEPVAIRDTDMERLDNLRKSGRYSDETSQKSRTSYPQKPHRDISLVHYCPPNGGVTDLYQCYIVRERSSISSKLYPTYKLYSSDNDSLLLLARKMGMNSTANYHLFDMTRGLPERANLSKKSGNYIGKLRGVDSNHSEYVVVNKSEDKHEVAGIQFDRLGLVSQLKDGCQPRKMKILLPQINADNEPIPHKLRHTDNAKSKPKSLVTMLRRNDFGNFFCLVSKDPIYENGNYRLNFHGRVSIPSVKNFQLTTPEDIDDVICQFGKVGDEKFNLDYKYPLNAFQAFSLALCHFDA